ncbi:MAG: IS1380 family transposase, partial [Tannerella sp.]|nr:IS1380 family transposase [Tannerella sp.]
MIDRSGFVSYPAGLPLPEQGSPRGYSPRQLFLHFMSGVWCGAERYTYLDIMRLDNSLQRLYGWKRMPEHKAFERYFRKFDMQSIQQ